MKKTIIVATLCALAVAPPVFANIATFANSNIKAVTPENYAEVLVPEKPADTYFVAKRTYIDAARPGIVLTVLEDTGISGKAMHEADVAIGKKLGLASSTSATSTLGTALANPGNPRMCTAKTADATWTGGPVDFTT